MADPISLDHLERKLVELHEAMKAGTLNHGEYDQRLARIIGELRERKMDADRSALGAKLVDLMARGVITPTVREHLEARLGIS